MIWHNVSLAIWALMAVVAIGVGIATATSHGRLATFGDFGRVLMRGRLAGATVIVIWMWLGWHFFAR